LTAYSDMF